MPTLIKESIALSMCYTSVKISHSINIEFKMKLTLFTILFLLTDLPNLGNCNDLQCFISGECTNSQGLDILPSRDEFQCLESCQQNANCTWFSFYPNSNLCQLFSICGSTEDTFCPNCISGQRGCDNPVPICFVQGNI